MLYGEKKYVLSDWPIIRAALNAKLLMTPVEAEAWDENANTIAITNNIFAVLKSFLKLYKYSQYHLFEYYMQQFLTLESFFLKFQLHNDHNNLFL